MIKDLWGSIESFYARFNTMPSPLVQRRVFNEEAQEVLEASIDLGWAEDALDEDEHQDFRMSLAEEVADAIYTALGVAFAHGLSVRDVEGAIGMVIRKNAAKTTYTHYLAPDGKIRRIK